MAGKPCYAGVDISKDTFNAHWLGKDSEFGNDAKGQNAFLKSIPEGSIVAMEATGNYHYRLALRSHKKGFLVMVLNPLQCKHWIESLPGGSSGKSDRIDAKRICAFAQRKEVAGQYWQPPSPERARAKVIVMLLKGLRKTRLAAWNRNHAAKLVVSGDDSSLDAMLGIIDVCDSYKETLIAELVGIMKKLYPNEMKLLCSINGIADKTASVMLAIAGDMSSFPSGDHLASYFELAPVTSESGSSVKHKSRISKKGNSFVRAMLYSCAGSALQYNKPMREFYQRLVKKGTEERVAAMGVARKLVVVAWNVVRSGEFWRADYKKAG